MNRVVIGFDCAPLCDPRYHLLQTLQTLIDEEVFHVPLNNDRRFCEAFVTTQVDKRKLLVDVVAGFDLAVEDSEDDNGSARDVVLSRIAGLAVV